jgi:hypothetical protein
MSCCTEYSAGFHAFVPWQPSWSSGRLARALLSVQGPSVLLRCLGIVGMLKSVAGNGESAAAGGSTVGGRSQRKVQTNVANSEALSQAVQVRRDHDLLHVDEISLKFVFYSGSFLVQEEALVRCANTLTGLARLHLSATWGAAGIDPVPSSVAASSLAVASSGNRMNGFRSFFAQLSGSQTSGGAVDGGTSLRSRIARGAAPTSAAVRRRGIVRALGVTLFRALQQDIGRALMRPVVVKALVRSLNARPMLPAHAAATSIALGALSLGDSGAGGSSSSSSPIDLLISHSAVESITNVMRTHASAAATLVAAANALGCIAICGRIVDESTGLLVVPAPDETAGSSAVATRGPSRQILRELQVSQREG